MSVTQRVGFHLRPLVKIFSLKIIPLRIGIGLFLCLVLVCVLGPFLTTNPASIVDPRACGLLPPLSTRYLVHLHDGSTLGAEQTELIEEYWTITRLGEKLSFPHHQVSRVEKRFFLLGTDASGRDTLARALHGGRLSLAIGALALLVTMAVGIGIGLVSGWYGGWLDNLLMRIVDALLAVPMLFLLLFLTAVFRPSLILLGTILGFSSWMGVARLVRGQVLSLKQRDFILAVRALGASPLRITTCHLLPNSLTPIAQDAALRLGDLILLEAALSYLGLGVPPPAASWGSMVADGQDVLTTSWWLTLIPSVLIALTVIAAALVADGLQQHMRGEIDAA